MIIINIDSILLFKNQSHQKRKMKMNCKYLSDTKLKWSTKQKLVNNSEYIHVKKIVRIQSEIAGN